GVHHSPRPPPRFLPRPRLGYTLRELQRRHQDVSACVRAHGIHRHVDLARSRPRSLHYPAHQPRPPHAREHEDLESPAPRGVPRGRRPHGPAPMTLNSADWLILISYFVLSAAIGIYYTRRAGKSIAEYFVSGRALPWWLAGTSMVATTFAVVLFAIEAGYSVLSGLWGVVVTDFFQFIVALGGCIVLAVLAVQRIGGLDRLVALAAGHYGSKQAAVGVLPPLHGGWLPLSSLVVFLAVQWWAAWYPGAEPGGGGYVAQRILSTKDERHGLLATLWFNIAHYALRPWPW